MYAIAATGVMIIMESHREFKVKQGMESKVLRHIKWQTEKKWTQKRDIYYLSVGWEHYGEVNWSGIKV